MVTRIAGNLNLTPRIVEDIADLYADAKTANDPWSVGKKRVLLTRQKGPFLKKCPGTKEYICCDYNILHIGSYCTMDCTYCILQAYFHPPVLQFFVNHDDLIAELEKALAQTRTLRIGTGEFTDSLIWEAYSDLTPQLIDTFARQDHAILELKTKTTGVDFLEGLQHRRKTIMAWSLNTPRVIATQERRTASLEARMKAATQCQSWGFPLAFHFDPIILYPGCESEYRQVVESLFQHVAAANIVWISLGTFRFMPGLKPIVQQRFPKSKIVYGEFITGLDNKMRYFKPMRIKIYQLMMQWIREFAPDTTVYLCMEDDEVWHRGLGFSPQSKGGLPAMLDDSIRRLCGCL
jgi:spore photoproduct lyase